MYAYAAKRRHLPPYTDNPFAGLGSKRTHVDKAKPVFVFERATELAFLTAADPWSFGVHFLLAKLGLRPGELIRLLIEDVDLASGWLQVRSRPELGPTRRRAVSGLSRSLRKSRRCFAISSATALRGLSCFATRPSQPPCPSPTRTVDDLLPPFGAAPLPPRPLATNHSTGVPSPAFTAPCGATPAQPGWSEFAHRSITPLPLAA